MKRYEYQMKNLLATLAKGFGIGLVVSFLLALLIEGGFSISVIGYALLIDLIVGSLISMFMTSSSGTQGGLANAAVNAGRGMIGGLFSAGFGGGVGMVFFIIELFFYGIIAGVLFLFAAISFPLTIVYTLVMFLIEKFKGEIDDGVADILDKIVPVVAFVITAIIIILIIKNG